MHSAHSHCIHLPASVCASSRVYTPCSGTRSVGLTTASGYQFESGDSYYRDDEVYWLSRIISAESSGEPMTGKPVDYVFVGSCTNGRIEDFRAFARAVGGRRKAEGVTVWLVPGSKEVERKIEDEGIGDALRAAGFQIRQPGCSACLAMNADKIPAGKYAVSTSNRNFEGRQGYGARTILAGPLVAAEAAVTGRIGIGKQ